MLLRDSDPNIAVKELAHIIGISTGSVNHILKSKLNLSKVCARWVPHCLTKACQAKIGQKFSSPDVLQYSYLTCQVSCTIGLPTDNFFDMNNANLSHDKAGRSLEVCGTWQDAIVKLLHTCRIKKSGQNKT